MGPDYLDLVKNEEIIAVNQDALGVAAVAVAASDAMVDFDVQVRGGRGGREWGGEEGDEEEEAPPPPCATAPPKSRLCCDHYQPGGCRARDEQSCKSQPNCCYAAGGIGNSTSSGTGDEGGSGSACWLNESPQPTPSRTATTAATAAAATAVAATTTAAPTLDRPSAAAPNV